ncbi:phage major capsid protein [Streptomyces sp. V4I2]|uniref:phage major capsid protein n=1 Tax=Streptomyces sp. V4I2 TaxID=3042280 RepID=UPI0027D8A07E|nr:phage major capsid protein [Streptomyces sp. V4I2]
MTQYKFSALDAVKADIRRLLGELGPEMKMTSEQCAELKALNFRAEELAGLRAKAAGYESGDGARLDGGGYGARSGGLKGAQTLAKGQRVTDWLKANGHSDPQTENLNFGRYMKGLVTGDWRGAEAERKAMSEGTLTAGGHVVPTPLASSLIDLVRNKMVVAQAGVTFVPMTTQTVKIPRLTGEGTPGWRNENALITDADLTFDAVTFTARSLARLVKLSRELFEDADPSAGDIIAHAFAAQLALELDRVALRGTGTAPEPRGVLNQSGITTTTHGANGAAIANYDFHLDAVGTVRNNNFEPNAQIQAPRTETSLSKLKEATTNAYLIPPAALAAIPRLNTKQVPTNLTVGTSTDCSEVYTGQWDMLGIGLRTGVELEFLTERYADNLQIGVLAHLRADVQVFHPEAFVVDTGVRA